MQFSAAASYYLSLLGENIFHSTIFSVTLNPYCSRRTRDQLDTHSRQ
jgi:hypothetical protein